MACYDRLDPFAENRARARGAARGAACAPASSATATPTCSTRWSATPASPSLLDPVLSVEGTGRFKTDPATYALGTDALGLAAAEVLFVSSNCWDAIGATWFGYTTLWVNRFGLPLDELGARADPHRHEPRRRARLLPVILTSEPSP